MSHLEATVAIQAGTILTAVHDAGADSDAKFDPSDRITFSVDVGGTNDDMRHAISEQFDSGDANNRVFLCQPVSPLRLLPFSYRQPKDGGASSVTRMEIIKATDAEYQSRNFEYTSRSSPQQDAFFEKCKERFPEHDGTEEPHGHITLFSRALPKLRPLGKSTLAEEDRIRKMMGGDDVLYEVGDFEWLDYINTPDAINMIATRRQLTYKLRTIRIWHAGLQGDGSRDSFTKEVRYEHKDNNDSYY